MAIINRQQFQRLMSVPKVNSFNQEENDYISFMKIQDRIHAKMIDFTSLCKLHNVKNLYAFGSATTDQFDKNLSDIDLLIEIEESDPLERGEKLLAIWEKLEEFFQRKVDLLTLSSLKNPILRKNIEATKILIYDGKRQEVCL
ncbi:nucleotidyltransferase domain-containing protein [Zunongwangia sp. F260]|uniref:Nucleotidyltransferase domain-containing protein n=1 Tax=Autumnicola lenta TaxID=3075593 RepID=A0ABU3CQR2_9FLAO|nr:nucleotidyltransferase domain-containing protein [Zunongwangia sp. F260]MDT0648280.1 nucleotidyltransferase domain-containing protein [Zunongwangia sp. F260]